MKKILPFLIGGIVIVGLVFGYQSFFGKKGNEASLPEGSESEGESTEKEFSGSLKAVMALGVPMKCTWEKDDNYSGSSWIKGKNSYGEINMEGKKAKMIFKDNCVWNWEEGNSRGIKICFEPAEAEEMINAGKLEEQGVATDMNYKCLPAVFTDAKFNPPADVDFMTMGQMMGQ